ncbi:MAG: DUF2911 domain-containing protein [Terriglobia bacterium]
MKKLALGIFSVLVVACLAAVAMPQGNPRGTSTITLKGKMVSVEYGRPSLKGRTTDELLGKLKPGAAWRLGADTSTTFKTGTDLAFGDVAVPAGEYSIWMERESDNSWKLVFNKQHGQWGTQHDASQDFASVPLVESKPAESAEMVTLTLSKADGGGKLVIQWGTLEATAHFKAK